MAISCGGGRSGFGVVVACFVSEKTDRLRGRARKTDEEEDRRRVVAKKIEPVVKWQIEIDKFAFCDVKG